VVETEELLVYQEVQKLLVVVVVAEAHQLTVRVELVVEAPEEEIHVVDILLL
jgi:hypothetical protein